MHSVLVVTLVEVRLLDDVIVTVEFVEVVDVNELVIEDVVALVLLVFVPVVPVLVTDVVVLELTVDVRDLEEMVLVSVNPVPPPQWQQASLAVLACCPLQVPSTRSHISKYAK